MTRWGRRMLSAILVPLAVVACTTAPPKFPPSDAALVRELMHQTVAIYRPGGEMPMCTGVWVDTRKILTAAHCLANEDKPLFYSTIDEYVGVGQKPKFVFMMTLAKVDEMHDLALFATDENTPVHPSAQLALTVPQLGEDIHIVGQSHGMAWSYKHGWMSALREIEFKPLEGDKLGPWLQISTPIVSGDSGGGAFNEQGELIGTAVFQISSIPNCGFYTHVDTIRLFLR